MAPLLPLETWREIIGYHPLHFWGLAGTVAPTSSCNALVSQHAWQQADAVGRADIALAIEAAEARLREHLGYGVAPRYTEETLAYPPAGRPCCGGWPSVQLSEGEVHAAGVEALTLIGTAALTFSDQDGDDVDDTFVTAALATTVTDADEIAVYFKAADRLDGEAAGERWRIAPVQVTISGGSVTVRGRTWLVVRPVLYEGFGSAATGGGLDPATAANFATHLEVYRRHTSGGGTTAATSQGVLIWEPGYCCGDARPSSTDPDATATAVARVGIRDARHGIVFPGEATYNDSTGAWSAVTCSACRQPDRVTVRYLAGLPLVDGQMDPAWRVVVARLAAAELDRRICACDAANRSIHRWQLDLAQTGGNNDEIMGAISPDDLNNPLGTRRGHVYAWRRIQLLAQTRGFLPG